MRRQRRTQLALRLLLVAAAVVFAGFPIIWIISASFNPSSSMATQRLVPPNASTVNYNELLNDPLHPFGLWLWNSVRVAAVTAFLVVLITAFGAYAFSRFRFRGRRTLLLTILLIQVFPNMLALIALFLLLQQIGQYIPWLGLNSHGGLILVYLGTQMGVNIWLMKGFFDSVPRDIDESALVDGASHWQVFWNLIVPLVRPVLAVVGILSFVGAFNEFILASVLLRTTEQFTLMVGLYLFVTQNFAQTWGVFAAGALIGALPIVALYLLLQDQIIGGLTQGAVKG
ncbi:MAG: sugar ABC transporter permease, partial [Anaerolineales bacterium]